MLKYCVVDIWCQIGLNKENNENYTDWAIYESYFFCMRRSCYRGLDLNLGLED